MMRAAKHIEARLGPGGNQASAQSRPPTLPAALVIEGIALAALLGLDGTPAWQLARLLVTLTATALAIRFIRRAGKAGRGLAALTAGIVGTVAGAGVAGAHLAKAGPDVTGVLAAIVFAAGLAELIRGTATLVRAIPGWRKLLAIPAGWILLEFVLFPMTVAVWATNQPPGQLGSATPADYGLTYQNAVFRTADGVRLSAWYLPSRNGAAVLVLPGSGSTRTTVLGQGAVLAKRGYGALLLDPRGHGRSGGHAMDFGWWGGRDVAAAVAFLSRQPGVRTGKIAVLGESMGGEQALAAMASDQRISAVVAEGATGEQLADRGWQAPDIGGILQRGIQWVQYTGAGLLSGAPRPIAIPEAIRAAAPRQVLLIAAGNVPNEPVAARWFQAASPASVEVWIVPHAGHAQGLAAAPGAWQAHVISFLNAALHPRSAPTGAAASPSG